MPRAKKTMVLPIPKVKERGVMPKPTRVIPDPKKARNREKCRIKMTADEETEER